MQPIEFPEQTSVLAKDQPEYNPLPIHRAEGSEGYVTSCWKLSPQEVELIGRTHKIWFRQMTFNQPAMPVFLSVSKKEMFDNVEEAIEKPVEFGITHNVTITIDLWDRIRVLFGKPIKYLGAIQVDRAVRILGDDGGNAWVPKFFERTIFKLRRKSKNDGMQMTNCDK